LRAVTPGHFRLPAVHVEDMYQTQINGSSRRAAGQGGASGVNIRSQRAVPIALIPGGRGDPRPLLLIGCSIWSTYPIDTGVVSWSTVVTDREERDLHLFLAEDER
jgi:hypothetical protein